MPVGMILALQAATPLPTVSGFELSKVTPSSNPIMSPSHAGCAASDEITVCGRRSERYRLPLPKERPISEPTEPSPASGMTALTPAAPCGIFAGQRRCSKKEALDYGYGGGRDPLTLGIKLVGKLIDPDAD